MLHKVRKIKIPTCTCNLWNATNYYLIYEKLRNAETETTKCYEMIYKLILAPQFRHILFVKYLHFFTFNYLEYRYTCKRSQSRSSEYGDAPNNFSRG